MMRRAATLALVLTVFTACARSSEGGRSGDQPVSDGGSSEHPPNEAGPQIDWNSPLRDGITLKQASDANAYVPFKVVDPGLGTATLIQVDDPQQMVAAATRTVAFVYNRADTGVINVEEQLAGPGVAQNLVARANAYAATPSPQPSDAQFQMVPLGDARALLVSQGNVGAEVWVQRGVLFEITGPALTPDAAQSLAATVYAAAA